MTFTTFDYADIHSVQVDNFGSGSITVEPGGPVVEGSLNGEDEVIAATTIRGDGGALRIVLPHRLFGPGNAHLRLSVPDDLSYSLRCASADVTLRAPARAAKIASGSGDISLGEVGDLDCTSSSGDVLVNRLTGRAARVVTGSGDIQIAEASCPVSAKSGSGDITVRSLRRAELRASSGSGDIAVPATTGSVDLRSASGSLTVGVAEGLAAWLDLNSVTGSVRIALEPGPQPDADEEYVTVRARTASGEIAVYRA